MYPNPTTNSILLVIRLLRPYCFKDVFHTTVPSSNFPDSRLITARLSKIVSDPNVLDWKFRGSESAPCLRQDKGLADGMHGIPLLSELVGKATFAAIIRN